MSPYVTFLLYLLAIVGFLGLVLTLNAWLGPKPAMTRTKFEPFECGATPVDLVNVKAVPIKSLFCSIWKRCSCLSGRWAPGRSPDF